jgi:outer membrane protein TolC
MRSAAGALLAGLAAFPLHAAEALSLPQAVEAARARSQTLVAREATTRAAREMAVAAGQRPDPVVRIALENVPLSGPDRFSTTRDFMTSKSVSLMQTLPSRDKRQARTARFEREAEAAQAEQVEQWAVIGRETAWAWFERHAREQRLALLREQLSETLLLVQTTESAVRSGGALADWIAARASAAVLQQALLGAEAEHRSASLTLTRWTGQPPGHPLAASPDIGVLPAAASHLAERLVHHPELVRLAAQEATLMAEAEVARSERNPDWSAEVTLSLRGAGYPNMVSVAFSVPWPWDRPQRQDRELAARLAQAEGLRAERQERAREHRAEVGRWLEGWRAGLAQMALIGAQRGPLAEQRMEVALAAYRGGRTPLSEVLAARRMALELRMEQVDLQLSTARLWTQLAYLIPDAAASHQQGVTP